MRVDQKISVVSTNATYVASAVSASTILSFDKWIMLGGFILGLLTFAVNWYYRHKTYKLIEAKEQQE